ncbi:MAG: hypothetical protein EZS28_000467 [Streblomastix strix]|uniref:Uncharacterized protein n=1 Tax=Streblomastix strix TaxID=222440 RepID=A0A5J4XBV5_9EUKA|nr:MAG: hypothetical protein EZS28_000467 [Streblomastix strix]
MQIADLRARMRFAKAEEEQDMRNKRKIDIIKLRKTKRSEILQQWRENMIQPQQITQQRQVNKQSGLDQFWRNVENKKNSKGKKPDIIPLSLINQQHSNTQFDDIEEEYADTMNPYYINIEEEGVDGDDEDSNAEDNPDNDYGDDEEDEEEEFDEEEIDDEKNEQRMGKSWEEDMDHFFDEYDDENIEDEDEDEDEQYKVDVFSSSKFAYNDEPQNGEDSYDNQIPDLDLDKNQKHNELFLFDS